MMDTGCSATSISWSDALRIEIEYSDFPQVGPPTGIGSGVKAYVLDHDIKLRFRSAERGEFPVDKHGIIILEHPEEKVIPSLLGNDFLDAFGLRLIYDRPVNAAYLDIP